MHVPSISYAFAPYPFASKDSGKYSSYLSRYLSGTTATSSNSEGNPIFLSARKAEATLKSSTSITPANKLALKPQCISGDVIVLTILPPSFNHINQLVKNHILFVSYHYNSCFLQYRIYRILLAVDISDVHEHSYLLN